MAAATSMQGIGSAVVRDKSHKNCGLNAGSWDKKE
jgi:hypothetical protein